LTTTPHFSKTNLVYNDLAEFQADITNMVDHHREKFGTGSPTSKVILADVTKKSQGKNLNLAKDSENYNLEIVQCFYPELGPAQG
jgi:hypothetical protein